MLKRGETDMAFLDRTNHERLAAAATARMMASVIADKYIPAADRQVAPTDNQSDDLDQLERDAIAAEGAEPDDDDFSQVEIDPDKELKCASVAFAELKAWMETTPVIVTPEIAKLGADWKHRTSISLKAADDERDAKVRPHNEHVRKVNAAYKIVLDPLDRLFKELRSRLTTFERAETAKREAAAALIRQHAEDAARIAREAEAQLAEAVDDAAQGAESDVGGAIETVEAALQVAARLQRQAAVAERDSHVRIPSAMGKAISGRTYKELIVADLEAAIIAIRHMGLTERIADAICLEAKAFKATWGELPEGVIENSEKRI
jgi:hypothetical protein